MKRFAVLACALALTACGVAPTATPRAASAVATREAAAGGFHDLHNKPISLAAFKGKPIVLSFLEPGTHDSEAQLPILIRLADAYDAQGVVFVMAGENASQQALKDYVEIHDLAFNVWEDRTAAEWRKRDFARVPAHEFRLKDGQVWEAFDGFMTRGQMTAAIEGLLGR